MSTEEQSPRGYDPRQRLVGALVLLALAVIFVPLVFDLRGGAREEQVLQPIPPKPEDFRVEILPLPAPGEPGAPAMPPPPPPMSQRAFSPPPKEAEPEAPQTPAAPAQVAAAEESAAKSPPAASESTAGESATGGSRIGEQAEDAANAQSRKPRAPSIARTTEAPAPPAGAQDAGAQRPSGADRQAMRQPARQEADTLPAGGDPSKRGWAVQLGRFTSPRNAVALRDRLQAQGFRVFVDQRGKGAQASYRVLAGPERRKAQAQRLRDRLRQVGVQGLVVPYEGEAW